MAFSAADLPAMLSLLKEMATVREVQSVLKQKNLPSSAASKALVYSERLEPAIKAGDVSLEALAAVLSDAEEHGRQHVLTYRLPKAPTQDVLDVGKVRKALQKIGAGNIIDHPRVFDKPDQPIFSEARLELHPKGQPKALIVKQVVTESRAAKRLKSTWDTISRSASLYGAGRQRACCTQYGFVEVRIQSHRAPTGPRRRRIYWSRWSYQAFSLMTPTNVFMNAKAFL